MMTETKSPASFRNKQHLIVSYDVFVNEQKHRLTMLYPFLSSDQIHSKLRYIWKKMNSKERANYCKVTSTPNKSLRGFRKRSFTPRCKELQLDVIGCKAKRLRCYDESSVNQQESTIFSKMEQCKVATQCKSYTNNFLPSDSLHESFSKVKEVSPRTVSDFCTEESEKCTPAKQKYTKTYIKTRYRPDCDLRLVPDVVDNTPSTKSGILKNRSHNAVALDSAQKRLSVSFSGNDLDKGLATSINPTESKGFEGDTYMDSDDEHDAVLLVKQKQVDKEEEKDCDKGACSPPETKNRDVLPERRTKNRSNHTQSKRKGSHSNCATEKDQYDIYNFEDIEKYEMVIETTGMRKNTNHSKTEKLLKGRSGLERDMQNRSKKIRGQNDINPEFKSPLQNPIQSRHKQKGTSEESSDIHKVGSRSKRVSSLETPALDLQITNKVESETTPLMDEGLQKLTLQEASKAPNKRKSSRYKASSDSQANRYEDIKKRVTKSLMRKSTSSLSNTEVAQIGEKGDARIPKTDDSEIYGKCRKSINISGHKDSSYAISKSQKKEPKTAHEMNLDGEELKNSDEDASFDDLNTYDSDQCSHYFGGFPSNNSLFGTSIRHSNFEIDSPLLMSESGDRISDPVEEEVGLSSKLYERNDALEIALAKLRRMVTCHNSPEVSSLSADSSPKLLSPALSGISELSSLSSESSLSSKTQHSGHDQIEQQGANGKMITETQPPLETSTPPYQLRNRTPLNEDDLCNMFREVTPEGKKSRLQGGRRLVASSKVQSNSNFKDLFNNDEIF